MVLKYLTENRGHGKNKAIYFILFLFGLSLFALQPAGAFTYSGPDIVLGNITLGFNTTLSLSDLYIDDVNASFIIFNTTEIHITSVNPVRFNLTYLHPNPSRASKNDVILEAYINCSGGSVVFTIYGLVEDTKYDIYLDNIHYTDHTADNNNRLIFLDTHWSTHKLQIIQASEDTNGNGGGDPTPPITCYKCIDGYLRSRIAYGDCPEGWTETRPSSCNETNTTPLPPAQGSVFDLGVWLQDNKGSIIIGLFFFIIIILILSLCINDKIRSRKIIFFLYGNAPIFR